VHKPPPFLPTFLISGPVPAPQPQLSIAPKQQQAMSPPATQTSTSYQHVVYVSSELAPPEPSYKMLGRNTNDVSTGSDHASSTPPFYSPAHPPTSGASVPT